MAQDQRSITSLFDRWARSYDCDLRQAPDGPLTGYRASLCQAAAVLPAGPEVKVLDIGIGTGALAALLIATGAELWGTDPSPAMLEQCRERLPEVPLRQGTFTQLPYAEQAFDLVVTSFAYHHVVMRRRRAALREMARVLRPGGTLGLLDIMFASQAALAAARKDLAANWDDDETYPLIGQLDEGLRASGFASVRWLQTGSLHWLAIPSKTGPEP